MTDGTPGWFRDPNDDSLARWHDGKSWTEHTLVIADQPPGVEPPPPQIDPEPEEDEEPAFTLPPRRTSPGRELPGWFKVAGPVAVVVLLVVAFMTFSGDDGDPADEAATVDTVPASLDEAVRAARRAGLSDEVSDPRAGALIERICAAAERPTAVDQLGEDLGQLPAGSPAELRQQVGALGVGADDRCPAEMEDAPDLIDDLQDRAVASAATTTVPDVGATDAGTDAGATDEGADGGSDAGDGDDAGSGRSTGTTRARSGTSSTATTEPPTTTTTLPSAQPNTRCSTEGATARHFVSGSTLTCQKACTNNRLVWRSGPCPTNPTVPPPDPNAPQPTLPATTTTTGGGTTGGSDGGP